MSQEIDYCLAGHSSNDFVLLNIPNCILFDDGNCDLCTKEHFIQEFNNWSSGNAKIDEIIQESQLNGIDDKLHWIPYDNLQNIKHIANGGHGSVYSAKLENGIKWNWNFIKRDWEYDLIDYKVALKEIKDSRFDIVEFLKVLKTVYSSGFIAKYYGISKNPTTQNYIFVMNLFDDNLHKYLAKTFWDFRLKTKIRVLLSIAYCLNKLHEKNIIHCDLHENDLNLNANSKNSKISGSIPYIPPEVLRGNEFTREGDIYSFGGIMYELVTAQQPFSDQAHDTYLMIDICNGVRPKVPDFMLNWIPECYLNLMYRCWSNDPSERPTAIELSNLFFDISEKLNRNIVDSNIMRNLKIADENQKNTSKSQKQELFELFSHSSKLHPQSCYVSRYIHTLHGLHDLLEEIKSGKHSGSGGRGRGGGCTGGKFGTRGGSKVIISLNNIQGKNRDKVGYRVWNSFRSKLDAGILSGLDNIYVSPKSKVLYLGSITCRYCWSENIGNIGNIGNITTNGERIKTTIFMDALISSLTANVIQSHHAIFMVCMKPNHGNYGGDQRVLMRGITNSKDIPEIQDLGYNLLHSLIHKQYPLLLNFRFSYLPMIIINGLKNY
ncbi:hypothetical protein Glove_756g33 [Diversispora epigaea]|uniref:Protein kinase domain-containing protein n=1 Tax=Diversispora epigaea TaxID=1348612 RepID=A0A397G2P7_9GLOM|nr:hypothetical protein Glove_756g33 [Diversispora epigaea]